jgi:hypothetical protein
MKVTTVRFGTDLWALLEGEAARVGVSVSQYIREAALARAAAAAAARGHAPYELLAGALREVRSDEPDPARRAQAEWVLGGLARLTADEAVNEAGAVLAQSEQARARRAALRSEAGSLLDAQPAKNGRRGRRSPTT